MGEVPRSGRVGLFEVLEVFCGLSWHGDVEDACCIVTLQCNTTGEATCPGQRNEISLQNNPKKSIS